MPRNPFTLKPRSSFDSLEASKSYAHRVAERAKNVRFGFIVGTLLEGKALIDYWAGGESWVTRAIGLGGFALVTQVAHSRAGIADRRANESWDEFHAIREKELAAADSVEPLIETPTETAEVPAPEVDPVSPSSVPTGEMPPAPQPPTENKE